MDKKWIIGIVIVVIACLCLPAVCLTLAGIGYYTFSTVTGVGPVNPTPGISIQIPGVTPGSPTLPKNSPTQVKPSASQTPSDVSLDVARQTLKMLMDSPVPINDPRDLARRLAGKTNVPETVPAPTTPYKVGDKREFWVTNVDTNKNFQVNAVLRYVSDHLYFWVEDGVNYKEAELKKMGDTFETKIYPTDRKFFGSEWTPGVDNDQHLYILYAGDAGGNLAGYYSSSDEVTPEVHEYSNAAELFLVNADNARLSDTYTYGVLAHEFQHMIHWYQDRNEDTWLNEGFAELAAYLNAYGGDDKVPLYLSQPDLQLTDWPTDNKLTSPHYGEAFLFVNYFLGRFGEKSTQLLVGDKDNGMDSVDKILKQINATEPKSGKILQADDVFADWAAANYVQDASVGEGVYTYPLLKGLTKPTLAETVSRCPLSPVTRNVKQYGVDYIRINCSGNYTLKFDGSQEVGVLEPRAHSGDYFMWSNKGDESDMTITRTFDFSAVKSPITLKYWTWYDLEKDYDYAYLVASLDGTTWEIVKTPSGTAEDPSGNSYGWGYNGETQKWIQETVDLSKFAGKKVTLRFEYVTDAAVNGEGMMIDDVEIPEINYKADFEKDSGGWESAGFVRIQNRLPQTYQVSVIKKGKTTTVETLELDQNNSASLQLSLGSDVKEVILVVSGTTRFTRQVANYRLTIN